MTKPNQLENWGEARRLKALELNTAGWSRRDIALYLGVSYGAVNQWLRRAVLQGRDSLLHRRDPGRTSRLSPDQLARLMSILTASPRALGFENDTWTRGQVRELIVREFGVSYHPAHVSRLLRAYGSPSTPADEFRQTSQLSRPVVCRANAGTPAGPNRQMTSPSGAPRLDS